MLELLVFGVVLVLIVLGVLSLVCLFAEDDFDLSDDDY